MSLERLVEVHAYASTHNFRGGFPNFHQADYGQGIVYGTNLLQAQADLEVRVVSARNLNVGSVTDFPALMRAVASYASNNGFFAGLPIGRQVRPLPQYRVCLLRHSRYTEWRDVRAVDFGSPAPNDVGARFRTTNDWADAHGYAAAFPNFHAADYGHGVVYGTVLFKRGYPVEWRDVPKDVLELHRRFTFASEITAEQRNRLLERHSFAYTRIHACNNLNREERSNLVRTYQRAITHRVSTNPEANAEAEVGGSWIAVNFGNLFPNGDREIAQSLIHEMVHCAGYTHPRRRDPCRPGDPRTDCPGDNGPYFGTPPLRAELCIAGVQSDSPGQDLTSATITIVPAAPDDTLALEHIVVRNQFSEPLDLTGWTIEDLTGHRFTFPPLTLQGAGEVRVWMKAGVGGANDLYWGPPGPLRGDAGEAAILRDAQGTEVARFENFAQAEGVSSEIAE
jgi:hypothetical protein